MLGTRRCRLGTGRENSNRKRRGPPRVANLTGKYLDCRIDGIDTSSGVCRYPRSRSTVEARAPERARDKRPTTCLHAVSPAATVQ